MEIINTSQQILEKGQRKQRNSQGKCCCVLFLQHYRSFAEQLPQEKAAVMDVVVYLFFIKTQNNSWTRVTGIQMVSS